MPDQICQKGAAKCLIWAADANGRLRAKDYFDDLREVDQKKFRAVFERFADTGIVNNSSKFNHEGDGLYVVKIFKHRITCFLLGNDVMLITGFGKKTDSDKRQAREVKNAKGLRDDYLRRNP